jgi:uncharacterized protein YbjT (DUF2867 family)
MILLTGATGTSGRPIVDALLARAERVRVLARDPEKAATLLPDEVEIVRGDLGDPQSLEAAMEGVDRALLLVASVENLPELDAKFIDAADRVGVPHVVKFSAVDADPNSPMRFMRGHGESEAKLKASGLAWTMLRPTFFLQNLLGMAGMIKRSGAIHLPTGDGRAPFVDTRDIAAVAAAALTERGHEGKTYETTGPRAISVADIAKAISDVVGREVKHVDVPPDAAKQGLLHAGVPEWNADGINELNAAMKDGQLARVTNTVREIGKKEPVTLEQFVREHADAFK